MRLKSMTCGRRIATAVPCATCAHPPSGSAIAWTLPRRVFENARLADTTARIIPSRASMSDPSVTPRGRGQLRHLVEPDVVERGPAVRQEGRGHLRRVDRAAAADRDERVGTRGLRALVGALHLAHARVGDDLVVDLERDARVAERGLDR